MKRRAIAGSSGVMWLTRMVWWRCVRRAWSVVTREMPTLPPRLRARLIKPVALFMRSLGTKENAMTLMGTNMKAMPPREIIHTNTNVQKLVYRLSFASWNMPTDRIVSPIATNNADRAGPAAARRAADRSA